MESGLGSEVNEQIRALMKTDIAAAAEKIRQCSERLDDVRLNVAITGQTGSGMSSFVNYFRGINDHEEGAATSGCLETITEPKPYPHPKHPSVIVWDLPGIGSPDVPAEVYFQKVGFEKFDFFIIISADRFRENDVKLATEIKRTEKKFYFVRAKIDQNFCNDKKSQKSLNEEESLEKIMEDCIKGLLNQGIKDPQVFLLSNFELHHEGSCPLTKTFEEELPELKRRALLMVMPNIFQEVIDEKKEAFQAETKFYGGLSAFGAAVPVPGLSVVVELGLLTVVRRYINGFGLDDASLQKLATCTGVPLDEFRFSFKSVLARREITMNLILKLLTQLANTSAIITTQKSVVNLSHFCSSLIRYRFAGSWFQTPEIDEQLRFIQILRIPLAPVLSFTTTSRGLNYFLDDRAEMAKRVFKKVLVTLFSRC